MISQDLLDIMACPLCKSALALEGQTLRCKNADCGCRYKIEDDIPVMLIEEAERPCPRCGQPRTWEPELDTLRCEKCGATYRYERPTGESPASPGPGRPAQA